MERKNVILHIRGIQFDTSWHGEEENDAVETVTTGILHKIGDRRSPGREENGEPVFGGYYVIKYEELQEDFDQASSVLLKAAPGRLELTKKGLLNVHMEFENGEYTQSDYSTPFGNILFGFHTRQVTVTEQTGGIQISASYMMEINGEYLADSTIEITAEYE